MVCWYVQSWYLIMFFFFNDTATTEIYTLSLHDALPISLAATRIDHRRRIADRIVLVVLVRRQIGRVAEEAGARTDRKSTRLNSSHVAISYAVFCLKKKKNDTTTT